MEAVSQTQGHDFGEQMVSFFWPLKVSKSPRVHPQNDGGGRKLVWKSIRRWMFLLSHHTAILPWNPDSSTLKKGLSQMCQGELSSHILSCRALLREAAFLILVNILSLGRKWGEDCITWWTGRKAGASSQLTVKKRYWSTWCPSNLRLWKVP
jgi:hypothetical protein